MRVYNILSVEYLFYINDFSRKYTDRVDFALNNNNTRYLFVKQGVRRPLLTCVVDGEGVTNEHF